MIYYVLKYGCFAYFLYLEFRGDIFMKKMLVLILIQLFIITNINIDNIFSLAPTSKDAQRKLSPSLSRRILEQDKGESVIIQTKPYKISLGGGKFSKAPLKKSFIIRNKTLIGGVSILATVLFSVIAFKKSKP